jgi:hypothetical protein
MRNKEIKYDYQTIAEIEAGRKFRSEIYEARQKIQPHGHKDREETLVPYRSAMQKQLDAMTEACASDISRVTDEYLNMFISAIVTDMIEEAQDCNNHGMDEHTLFVLRQATAIKEYLKRAPLDNSPQI